MPATRTNSTIVKEKQEWRLKGFAIDQPEKFELSLELGTNHLSYAVYDGLSRFLKVVGKIEFEFLEKKDSFALLFSELQSATTDLFRPGYNRVYLTMNTPGATLIPTAFYGEHLKEDYLKLNTAMNVNQLVLTDEIKGGEITVIYCIKEAIKLFLDAQFSNHKTKHISTSLLEIISSSTSRKKEKIALLNLNSSDFNLVLIDGKLRFFNTFAHASSEDILYFILFAMEQNSFDPQSDKLLICGEIEIGSGTHKLLQQYIKNISFALTDKNIIRSEELANIPHHYFFNLLNRLVCG